MGNFFSRIFSDSGSKKNASYAVTDDTTRGKHPHNTEPLTTKSQCGAQTGTQPNLIKGWPNHETPTEQELEKVRAKLKPINKKDQNTNTTTPAAKQQQQSLQKNNNAKNNKQELTRKAIRDDSENGQNLVTPELEDAVIKIQAQMRGYLTRKHMREMKRDNQPLLHALN